MTSSKIMAMKYWNNQPPPPPPTRSCLLWNLFNRIRTFVVLWRRQSQIIHNSPGSEDPVRGIHSIGRLWIRTHITYLPSRLWGGQGEDRKNQCVYPIKGLLWTVGTPLNHVYIIDVVTEQKNPLNHTDIDCTFVLPLLGIDINKILQ